MLSRIAVSIASAAVARTVLKSVPVVRAIIKAIPKRNFAQMSRTLYLPNKQLVDFLKEEIELERGAQKFPGKLPNIQGFAVTSEGANITLNKTYKDEKVTVKFNVNHTVDAEADMDAAASDKDEKLPQMVSRPSFTVEIAKDGKPTFAIHCVYPMNDDVVEEAGNEQAQNEKDALPMRDVFEIEEVAFHSGEWKDSTYAVSGDVMDGNLYDLLMSALEERGVDEQFSKDLIKFSTAYEHKQYIGFLDQLKSFAEK